MYTSMAHLPNNHQEKNNVKPALRLRYKQEIPALQ